MLSFLSHPTGPVASSAHQSHPSTPSMFEDDLLGQRARSFPGLGHGMLSAAGPQAFPFAGFPMHPAHDPMGFGKYKYSFLTFTAIIYHIYLPHVFSVVLPYL